MGKESMWVSVGVGEMGMGVGGGSGRDGEGEHGAGCVWGRWGRETWGEGWVSGNVKHRNGHGGDGKENVGVGGIEKGNMGGYDKYGKGRWGNRTWRREAEG